MLTIKCKKLYDCAKLPSKSHIDVLYTPDDLGWDFYCFRDDDFELTDFYTTGIGYQNVWCLKLKPGQWHKFHTGVSIQIQSDDNNCYGLILKDRSGLANKGLHILGGIIDFQYTGQIYVMLYNFSNDIQIINAGDRIAQGIITKMYPATIELVEGLMETNRGDSGFGSSGN